MSSIKTLRENLCSLWNEYWPEDVKAQVRELIVTIDRHRPLGSDGTHGNDRHTTTCGCQNVGYIVDDWS